MSLSRNLPVGWAVRRATTADARYIAGRLRPVDRAAFEALENRPVPEMLADTVSDGGLQPARVLTIAARPAVLYGLAPCDGLPRDAAPWFATVDDLAQDELVDVMWMSRHQLDLWRRRWPSLWAFCDCRNHFHRQWLVWLGFALRSHLESFGAAGLPFDLYMRETAPTRGRISP